MNEQNLKNCPFCGGKSIFITLAPCHGYIACIGDCGFQSGDYWDDTMANEESNRTKWNEIASKAWNRRHIDG